MFDATLRPLIDPPLRQAALRVYNTGATPNQVTLGGLGLGLLAVPFLWAEVYWLALLLILLNRISDGLDGALARIWAERGRETSTYGGFLDISCDFIFYAAIPLGFALADPGANALAAAFLLATFICTGTSFLAFAILAEQHGWETQARGRKSFYYIGGLAEGTETIAVFVLLCLLPTWFPWVALVYGLICIATVFVRFLEVRDRIIDPDQTSP